MVIGLNVAENAFQQAKNDLEVSNKGIVFELGNSLSNFEFKISISFFFHFINGHLHFQSFNALFKMVKKSLLSGKEQYWQFYSLSVPLDCLTDVRCSGNASPQWNECSHKLPQYWSQSSLRLLQCLPESSQVLQLPPLSNFWSVHWPPLYSLLLKNKKK